MSRTRVLQKAPILLILLSCQLLRGQAPAAPAPPAASVENSVVKIFATYRYPDPYRPWTKQAPSEGSGTGIVIDGKRILTNAHVVLYAGQIQIQANQSGDKIFATVEAIAPGIDLAVLKLDDESFFGTHAAIQMANKLPEIKDTVLAYGYPTGGNSLSITKGIVSRIEFVPYNFPVSGLRIQIDAAINPGNSGGPALVGDKMIGVAFSFLGNAQNIGYIIPSEEVELFLNEISGGHYAGKPSMYEEFQKLQNPAVRSYLKIDKTVSGYVVHGPYLSDPSYPIKKWDVITKIGDTPVDDEGMIKLGENLRVNFEYLVQRIARDDKVPLTVFRAGKTLQLSLPVNRSRPMLIKDLAGEYPSYFVFGPLVFTTATVQFVAGIDKNGVDNILFAGSPLLTRKGDAPAFDGEQLVIVSSPFFPHKISEGYWNPIGWVVKAVNGTPIRNLNHLVETLRDATGDFVSVDFAGRGTETFIFNRKEALASTDEILTDNGVRAQGSPDTLAAWGKKPAN